MGWDKEQVLRKTWITFYQCTQDSKESIFNLCHDGPSVLSAISLREFLMHRIFLRKWKVVQMIWPIFILISVPRQYVVSLNQKCFQKKKWSKSCKNYIKNKINKYLFLYIGKRQEDCVFHCCGGWCGAVFPPWYRVQRGLVENYHVWTILWPPESPVNKPRVGVFNRFLDLK